ncbi:MAG: malonate decarboxylase holo-[acyl-carrier-protein] synthase [Alphaproteobacteria bacterium RIFCSPHIGHO2_12_FULL_66_14]|nr:MAG: malonate decarboxylase holo-[acyl-carrier-protein] synthase [Alphaproteobacteria bacterium RIFCSPHIGHO2_12_FULL_66_14]
MTGLHRHALVWLSQVPEADDESDRQRVEQWHVDGRPFVVCRRRGERGEVSLGFCAVHEKFPEIRPRRIGAHALAAQVVRMAEPPVLAEVARCGPAVGHASAFARLADGAAVAGLDLRVYGSWMWQTLTGERHVRPSSDLDLFVPVAGPREAENAAAFLEGQEAALPFKLDGELSFPGVGEVQWREYRLGAPEVLLKTVDTVRMIRREELRP